MSKMAFIYPGQGAQKIGMGQEFYEKELSARQVFDQASGLLDLDMPSLCFCKNDKLDKTEYTQAALVTTCCAMTAVVMERGLSPDITAGLSLGEYAAIATAGGMSVADAITLVRKRGIIMQEAVPLGEGAMSAILGLSAEAAEQELESIEGVSIANYNCPGQIVITGSMSGVALAETVLKQAGAKRVMRLNVSGPFHSSMLEDAGKLLGKSLEPILVSELRIPYVTNVTAECVTDSSKIKPFLREQVSSSVRWEQSIRQMIEEGVDTFVEIGPGKTLAGLIKKIDSNVNIYNIQTLSDVERVVGELKECIAKEN